MIPEPTYRLLFDANPIPMWVYDVESLRFLAVNDAALWHYGYTREEFLALTIADIRPPEDLPRLRARLEEKGRDASRPTGPWRHLRKDGSVLLVNVRGHDLDSAGRKARLIAAHDVTERTRVEEEQARLMRAVEQSAEAILITDPLGTILYVNPAFEAVTGYSREEAMGANPRILKSGHQDPAFYARMWSTLARGEVWKGRLVNRRKDGAVFLEDATISPVHDAGGHIVSYVAVKRDVTHEASLERQLAQAQKLEALGRLAGGIAHDFNNLLGVITGYGEMVHDRMEGHDPHRGKLALVLEAADRAAGLTRQLLAFSRQQVLQPRVLDLNTVVAATERMLRRLIGEDIELQTSLAPGLPHVKADPGQLEQVIINLAVNARDAMPGGGRLTIGTELADVAPEKPDNVPPGRWVVLVVDDTGVGMDEATQTRAFEPFFTSKEVGKGTGLGLATVYGIAQQSGGRVVLRSAPGQGSTFRVYLPAVAAEVAPAAPPVRLAARTATGGTVLLIEDDVVLRGVLSETLEGDGYTVLVAGTGAEALRVGADYGGRIAAVVSDIVLPGMSGPEAVRQLLVTRPEMKVLFISGYTDETISRLGALAPGSSLLNKPFHGDELLLRLRQMLGAAG